MYLVGAGPGHPGLLTVRAAELLEAADVVVYDALANDVLLERCRDGCELIYVGKRAGQHSRSQEEIEALLISLAGSHRSIVRLKGGDPFVFGRGGEEALALRRAGIPFEVVPGVTAGVAAPAFAGIPVTHRHVSASATFLTGHEDPQKPDSDLNWDELARMGGTLVFYMGVGKMAVNFERLIHGGRDARTPAAVIEWGTYPRQRTVSGTLESLPELAAERGIGAPAIVVGRRGRRAARCDRLVRSAPALREAHRRYPRTRSGERFRGCAGGIGCGGDPVPDDPNRSHGSTRCDATGSPEGRQLRLGRVHQRERGKRVLGSASRRGARYAVARGGSSLRHWGRRQPRHWRRSACTRT